MAEERKKIAEYLLEKGIINKEQLKQAIEEHKKPHRNIDEILVRCDFAKEEDIAQALSEQLGFTFIDLSSYQIRPTALELISADIARRLQVIPILKIGNSLTIAMADPLDLAVIDELRRLVNLSIEPVLSASSGINKAIAKYYGGKETELTTPVTRVAKEGETVGTAELAEKELPKSIQKATQAPVIKLVNKLISDAVKLEASDIHLEPQENNFYCRYRVDGILQAPINLEWKLQSAVVSRIKIMANIDIAEKRLPQDGRIHLDVEDKKIDLRVATFPTIYGEHVAIRILDKSIGILKLEELGFAEDILKRFKSTITRPYGIILVTGPTGCGKTTTLYSSLNTINDAKKNIITLEDPVEYTIERIHQSQVNVKAGLTFASGLRSIVRLDPDIIMIGEIRDKETAEIAIHAALTGHLVFSTLHTNDASSACARLIDIGAEPFLVSSSVSAILAQRLVRRLCPKCKKAYRPSEEEILLVSGAGRERQGKITFYKEAGCKNCRQTGYKGRAAIFELLIPQDSFRELIVKKTSAHEMLDDAKRAGMKTLREDGLDKVKAGITTVSEVLRVTEEI